MECGKAVNNSRRGGVESLYSNIKTISTMDKREKPRHEEDAYRGVDVNKADDGKDTNEMVKQDIKDLNNNPRNSEIDN